ncbi:MAG: hypothetical protein CL609_22785 [Anaerolineaceae bacterium]|nr:hypothetical protein [Anaerolineaceae bacterium]
MNESLSKPLKIAIDFGFHSIKAASFNESECITFSLPSVVGVGDTSIGLLKTGISRAKKDVPYTVVYKGQSYLVGPFVSKFCRPVERVDFDRLIDCIELRVMIYAALSGLIGKLATSDAENSKNNSYNVTLVIALPVQVLQSETAKKTVRDIANWLEGYHEFSVDKLGWDINVIQIIPMAQPLGRYFEWGLNNDGSWGLSKFDFNSSVGILDQGFNTIDLLHVQEGQIIRRFTGGETLGQRRAAHLIQKEIFTLTSRKLTLHEADEIFIKHLLNSQDTDHYQGIADISAVCKKVFDMSIGELRSFLEQYWDNGKQFDVILLSGGGSIVLQYYIASMYRHLEIPAQPVFSNAIGFSKFAQRKNLFKRVSNWVA